MDEPPRRPPSPGGGDDARGSPPRRAAGGGGGLKHRLAGLASSLTHFAESVGEVVSSAVELLKDEELKRKGANLIVQEATNRVSEVQRGLEAGAESLQAGARARIGAGAARLQAVLRNVERQIAEFQRQQQQRDLQAELEHHHKLPVDVQIGDQVFEDMPQEIRSRLWYALLDRPELADALWARRRPPGNARPGSSGVPSEGARGGDGEAAAAEAAQAAEAEAAATADEAAAGLAAAAVGSDRAASPKLPTPFATHGPVDDAPDAPEAPAQRRGEPGGDDGAGGGSGGGGAGACSSGGGGGGSGDCEPAAPSPWPAAPNPWSAVGEASAAAGGGPSASGEAADAAAAAAAAAAPATATQAAAAAAEAVHPPSAPGPAEGEGEGEGGWELVATHGPSAPVGGSGELEALDSLRSLMAGLGEEEDLDVARAAQQAVFAAMLEVPWVPGEGLDQRYDQGCEYARLLREGCGAVDDVISRDVPRTFPEHPLFCHEDGRARLQRVLRAYAAADPEVGYCQGMAFMAGVLLMYLPEEPAFRLYRRLMCGPANLRRLYLPGLDALKLELSRFELLLSTHHPQLHQHLLDAGLPALLYAAQWYMTGFSCPFPLHVPARVVDVLLQSGSGDVLPRLALAVLGQLGPGLLEMEDFEALITRIKVQPLSWPLRTHRRVMDEALHGPVTGEELRAAAEAAEAEYRRLGRLASFSTTRLVRQDTPGGGGGAGGGAARHGLAPGALGCATEAAAAAAAAESSRHASSAGGGSAAEEEAGEEGAEGQRQRDGSGALPQAPGGDGGAPAAPRSRAGSAVAAPAACSADLDLLEELLLADVLLPPDGGHCLGGEGRQEQRQPGAQLGEQLGEQGQQQGQQQEEQQQQKQQ